MKGSSLPSLRSWTNLNTHPDPRWRRRMIWILRHIPPGMRGKARIARRLLGRELLERDATVVDRYGCEYLVPSLREPIAFYLLVDAVYEPDAMQLLLSRLGPGSCFVDVGTSIGTFTIPAARRVGPTGRVLAIEASPRIFPYLAGNVVRNRLANVVLEACAATDSNDRCLPFYLPPPEKFGMGSLGLQFDERPVSMRGRTIDRLLSEHAFKRVDVLKLDIEGYEVDALRGAEDLLTGPTPPLVLFEFCDWAEARNPGADVGASQRLLASWGYRIWRLRAFCRGDRALDRSLHSGLVMLVATREN